MSAAAGPANALPTGGTYAAGSGTISTSGSQVKINQSTLKGIIDWNTFSLGLGNKITFNNGKGATLNRVTGGDMSTILGSLSATGSVYLINPQGILIGNGAQVKTGGDFVASTLHLDPSTFMNGGALSFQGDTASVVVNLGNIYSKNGSVFLIGNGVKNSGTINAATGEAGLAAGTAVLLKESNGDQRIFVKAPGGDVTNEGTIQAAQAELKTQGGNIYALAGNNGGLIKATGTQTIDGQAWLIADGGNTNVTGQIAAKNADGTGGHVETSGRNLNIAQAKVNTGTGGNWLLDPVDLTIDSGAASTIVSTLNSGTNVNVQTTSTGSSGPGTTASGNGDINVASDIHWYSQPTLTLSAYRNINVNTNVKIINGCPSGSGCSLANPATGNLILQSDNTGTGSGTVSLGSGSQLNWTNSSGSVVFGYNPTGSSSTKYTNWASNKSTYLTNITLGSSGATFFPRMYVNGLTDFTNVETNTSAAYWLNTNLDGSQLNSGNFAPIGSVNGASHLFTGNFDGVQHTISNFTWTDTSNNPVGLFAGIGTGGGVKNLWLQNANVSGTGSATGVLAGSNAGTISQVAVDGLVTGTSTAHVGGLVGNNTGTITDSYSITNIVGGNSTYTGGLVGYNNGGSINTSYSAGLVPSGGGLVGSTTGGSATNSYWLTDTSGQSSSALGSAKNTGSFWGSLFTGFNSSVWSNYNAGHPTGNAMTWLTWQFPSGVQVFDGYVYSDLHTTAVPGSQVAALINGVPTGGIVRAGANGYYNLRFPAGTIGSSTAGLLYLPSGTAANTLVPPGTMLGTGYWTLDLYQGWLRLGTGSLSTALNSLGTALGSQTGSRFLYSMNGQTPSYSTNKAEFGDYGADGSTIDTTLAWNGTLLALAGGLTQTAPISTTNLLIDTAPYSFGQRQPTANVTSAANSVSTIASVGTGFWNYTNAGNLATGTVGGYSGLTGYFALNALGNLTLNAPTTMPGLTGYETDTFVTGGTFTNLAGASGLPNFSNYGRWLVWSQDPRNDTKGVSNYVFKQYNATYGNTSPALGVFANGAAGNINGFLYVHAPVLTAAMTGTITRQYDANVDATVPASQIQITGGYIDNDSGMSPTSATGHFQNKNVGNNKQVLFDNITVSPGVDTSNGAAVYGYSAAMPSYANAGFITQAPLGIAISASDKTYDTTDAAQNGQVQISGLLTGPGGLDQVTLNGSFGTVHFSDANADSNNPKNLVVSGSGISLSGADVGNYNFNPTPTGTAWIYPKNLAATLTSSNKVYDGTSNVTSPVTLSLSTGSGANQVYPSDAANVHLDTSNASYFFDYFTADPPGNPGGNFIHAQGAVLTGSAAGNYSFYGYAPNSYYITPAPLYVPVTVTPKPYDGNANATVTFGQATGFVAADVSNYNIGLDTTSAQVQYVDQHAGTGKGLTPVSSSFNWTDNCTGCYAPYFGPQDYTINLVTPSTTNAATGTITPLAVTGSITAQGKVYNGNTNAVGALSLTGVLSADQSGMVITNDTYTFASKNAGTRTVTESGAVLSSSGFNDYVLQSNPTTTAVISQAPLTGTVTGANKAYNSTTADPGASVAFNAIGSDDVHLTGGTYAFNSPHTGSSIPVNLSGGSLTGNDAANYTLGAITAGSANITQRTLTGTANGQNRNFDNTNSVTVSSVTLNGVQGADNVAASGGSYQLAGVHAGTEAISASGVSLVNNAFNDYVLGTVTGQVTINPLPINATVIGAQNKVYDSTTTASASLTLDPNGIISGAPVSANGAQFNFASTNVGTGIQVTASNALLSDSDYTLGTVTPGSANITQRTLTATLSATPRTYDTTTGISGVNVTLNGIQGADTVSTSGGIFSLASSHAGSDAINASGITLTNNTHGDYALGTETGSVTINPATVRGTVTGAQAKTYDSTNSVTGASLTLNSSDLLGQSATVSNDTYQFASIHAGSGIQVNETGGTLSNTDFTLGTITPGSANITQRQLTGTINASNKTYDTTTNANVTGVTLNGVQGPDTTGITGGTYTLSSAHVGTRTISASGQTLTNNGNNDYTLGSLTGSEVISAAPVRATVNTATTRAYDGTTSAADTLTLNSADTLGQLVSLSGGTYQFNDPHAGNKTVTVAGATLNNSDFTLGAITAGTGVITPAPVTVTVTGANKTYDSTTADPGATAIATGAISGQSLGVTGNFNFSDQHAANGKTVSISGATLAVGNGSTNANDYSITNTVNGAANIAKYTLNGTISDPGRAYNSTSVAANATLSLSPTVNNENPGLTVTSFQYNDAHAGNKTVTETGAALSDNDYQLGTITNGSAVITPAPVRATVNTATTRAYDGTTSAADTLTLNSADTLGQLVSLSGGTYQFNDPHAGNKTVTVAGATLNNSDFTLGAITAGTGVITPAPVTVTVTGANKAYDATTTDPGATAIATGAISGQSLGVTGNFNFSDQHAANGKTVSISGATLAVGNGSTNANDYSITNTVNGAANIAKYTLNGTISDPGRAYNSTSVAANATLSLSPTVNNENPGLTVTSFQYNDAHAGNKTVTETGAALSDNDYQLGTITNGSAVITPAPVRAAINTASTRAYDGNDCCDRHGHLKLDRHAWPVSQRGQWDLSVQ